MLYFDIKINGNYSAEGIYYNSSSRDTIDHLKKAVQYYKKHQEEPKDILYAVKLLEFSGFALGEQELGIMQDFAPNACFKAKKGKDGRISFYIRTQHLENKNLYDSFISLDIVTGEITFNSFVVYTKQPAKMLVQTSIDVDWNNLTLDDLPKIEEAIQQDEDCFNCYIFKDRSGTAVRFLRGQNEN